MPQNATCFVDLSPLIWYTEDGKSEGLVGVSRFNNTITYTYNAWGEFTTMTHNGGYSTAGFGTPGAENHMGVGYTWVIPYTRINIFDIVKKINKKIEEW